MLRTIVQDSKRPFMRRFSEGLNTCMKQFRATVRVGGMVVTTVVFAENTNFAIKILQAQFGANNVISIPTQIG
ncbi:MAG: hypothetical protein B7Y55_01385 [Polynucleobacter sp. 35-46-207]|nr:MAG: hypothetical protein B7Y55_01385 [Polynucleobacter sp. 35-46-207]OZB48883.1 MAG: hypothetical protein B7X60_02855 [Polynucleobacter sp. 39-45-136]